MKANQKFKAMDNGTSRAEVANRVVGSEITNMMLETERKVKGRAGLESDASLALGLFFVDFLV